MRISRSTRFMTLLVAVVPGMSCNKSSDTSPRLETSAAAATPARPAPPAPESTPAAVEPQKPETSTAAKPVRPKPAARRASPAPQRDAPADTTPAPAAPANETSQDKWLSYDAATNTVTFELVAGPFTFNGYRDGGATLVVPPKANVVMNFVNKDGTPHSAIVISGEGAIPNSADVPAIPRAYTSKVLEGMPQEASDVMRFPVPESGTYRIFCGVPGHGLSGMWIWMKVDPAAKEPSFGPKKA